MKKEKIYILHSNNFEKKDIYNFRIIYHLVKEKKFTLKTLKLRRFYAVCLYEIHFKKSKTISCNVRQSGKKRLRHLLFTNFFI